jgi:hypothetical protein
MKKIILLCMLFITYLTSQSQDCRIILKVGQDRHSFSLPTNKPILFQIKSKDTILKSSPDGVLIISKKFLDKKQNDEVFSFDFLNKLDWEFYREPMFTRTRRVLKEYCGLTLVAAPRE